MTCVMLWMVSTTVAFHCTIDIAQREFRSVTIAAEGHGRLCSDVIWATFTWCGNTFRREKKKSALLLICLNLHAVVWSFFSFFLIVAEFYDKFLVNCILMCEIAYSFSLSLLLTLPKFCASVWRRKDYRLQNWLELSQQLRQYISILFIIWYTCLVERRLWSYWCFVCFSFFNIFS